MIHSSLNYLSITPWIHFKLNLELNVIFLMNYCFSQNLKKTCYNFLLNFQVSSIVLIIHLYHFHFILLYSNLNLSNLSNSKPKCDKRKHVSYLSTLGVVYSWLNILLARSPKMPTAISMPPDTNMTQKLEWKDTVLLTDLS